MIDVNGFVIVATMKIKSNLIKKIGQNSKLAGYKLYPLSRWVGLDASPLDSLILLSHSLSLVIPDMLNNEESSSGLLCSDFLEGSKEVGLGSWDVSREWDFLDTFSRRSIEGLLCDLLPT